VAERDFYLATDERKKGTNDINDIIIIIIMILFVVIIPTKSTAVAAKDEKK